jgi:hypothetical protein
MAGHGVRWVYNDGGRAAAGINDRSNKGDCACRAIAIATGKPYREVYNGLNALCAMYGDATLRRLYGWRHKRPASADTGIPNHIARLYLGTLQWRWIATNNARLHRCDLPAGRIIVVVSKHLVALVDNVVHDTGEHWRGHRPVHGYYQA